MDAAAVRKAAQSVNSGEDCRGKKAAACPHDQLGYDTLMWLEKTGKTSAVPKIDLGAGPPAARSERSNKVGTCGPRTHNVKETKEKGVIQEAVSVSIGDECPTEFYVFERR